MKRVLYFLHSQMMTEYWNNPEATSLVRDTEGWFHTGDIGVIDENDYITIIGRKKELIKYYDQQVSN